MPLPFLFTLEQLFSSVIDEDDDNFHHHGNLVQLLTYSKQKYHPGQVKQVLLTPKQSHITSLSLVANSSKDSYDLPDIDTLNLSSDDHFMSEYLPNLYEQLHILSHDSLSENYAVVADEFKNAITQYYQKLNEIEMAQSEIRRDFSNSPQAAMRSFNLSE